MYLKKENKWVPFCYTVGVEWVTVMIVLNFNSMIYYHCIHIKQF